MSNHIKQLTKIVVQPAGRGAIPELNMIRAISILYIVFVCHLANYSYGVPTDPTRLIGLLAHCCVANFVFISGFLLSHRYTCSCWNETVIFYRSRFLRIYPMYILTLSAFYLSSFIDARTCLNAALLVQILTAEDLMTLWFVNMILLFYLLVPFYLKKYSTMRTLLITAAITIVLGAIKLKTHLIDIRILQYLPLFTFGIIVPRYGSSLFTAQSKRFQISFILLFLGLAYFHTLFRNFHLPEIALEECAMFVSIPLFWNLGSYLARTASLKILSFISYCAFSIYLVHRLTFALGVHFYQPMTPVSSLLYLIAVLSPLTVIAAYVFQWTYDGVLGRIFRNHKRTAV
jgi:peptidoglycan/LPS O-acetylase OafA/YrhL